MSDPIPAPLSRESPAPPPRIPSGVWPVMLTPFKPGGAIDWTGLDALVDWYIQTGVSGLFSVCLSSEMYELSPEERIRVAQRVVDQAAGRVPVVAAGAFGETLELQVEAAQRLRDTGVEAVVLTVNQLAAEDESDDVWRQRAEAVFGACDRIPLGLYECPRPYHRKLAADTLGWAAGTERVFFYKDTCCSLPLIRTKLAAIRGTPLTWLNAHAPTLLDSLLEGGHGYSSIAANFIPELYVWLCRHFTDQPERARELQAFLTEAQNTICVKYLRNAKHYLQRLGLPINPACRVECDELNDADLATLDALRNRAQEWFRCLEAPRHGD